MGFWIQVAVALAVMVGIPWYGSRQEKRNRARDDYRRQQEEAHWRAVIAREQADARRTEETPGQ